MPRLSEAEIKNAVSPKAKEDTRVMKPKRIVRQPTFKLAAH